MKRFLLCVCVTLPATLLAQDGPKDPFATPPAMGRAANRADATPRSGDPRAPRLNLAVRGTLAVRGKAPAALLQVGERVLLVRAGERLQVGGVVLTVKSIQGGAVTVQLAGDPAPLTVR